MGEEPQKMESIKNGGAHKFHALLYHQKPFFQNGFVNKITNI